MSALGPTVSQSLCLSLRAAHACVHTRAEHPHHILGCICKPSRTVQKHVSSLCGGSFRLTAALCTMLVACHARARVCVCVCACMSQSLYCAGLLLHAVCVCVVCVCVVCTQELKELGDTADVKEVAARTIGVRVTRTMRSQHRQTPTTYCHTVSSPSQQWPCRACAPCNVAMILTVAVCPPMYTRMQTALVLFISAICPCARRIFSGPQRPPHRKYWPC